MDFHQTCEERFAEKIINFLSEKFDGKVMNSSEMTVEIMIKSIPSEPDDDIVTISPVPEKVIKTVKVSKDISNDINEQVLSSEEQHNDNNRQET